MIFNTFRYKDTNIRINTEAYDIASNEIIRLREELETFISGFPDFVNAMRPLSRFPESAPETAILMHQASKAVRQVGPMAAVAGTMAQLAGKAAKAVGSPNVLIDNGGDLYLDLEHTVSLGIFAGNHPLSGKIALRIEPDMMPCSLCASSGKMGHSFSAGRCDLALVYGKEAPLVDATATYAANLVSGKNDLDIAAEKIMQISGISGVLLLQEGLTSIAGTLPEIIPCHDKSVAEKVTRDSRAFFPFLN